MRWPISFALIALLIFSVTSPTVCFAADGGPDSFGIRIGFSATPKLDYFLQYEAFAKYKLPWQWSLPHGLNLATQAVLTVGDLSSKCQHGFIGSLGPALSLEMLDRTLSLNLGVHLDVLGKRKYEKQDFGSNFLFGAYIGADYHFSKHAGLGYRLQHVSLNKIFYPDKTPNPGLDLHMFSLDWNF